MTTLAWLLLGLCATVVLSDDPMEDPNLFEGDMILTDDQRREFLFGDANYQIPLAAIRKNLWPKTIPYTMDSTIASSSKAKAAINAAIADYERLTCLRFKNRTDEPGYLYFYKGGGCSSPVGYYRRANRISLAGGCWHKGIVMHEIAHSLGFYHEQSRPDRDNYVTINWENISSGKQHNFRKKSSSSIGSMGVPYDYRSIMHYRGTAFSKNGQLTIKTKNESDQKVIGNRKGFSNYDIKQMNLLYRCPGPIPTNPPTTAPPCVDKHRGCPSWKSRGYCKSTSRYYRYMTKNCRKSCGICGGGNATTSKPTKPTTRPSTRPTTRPSTRPSTQPPTRPPTTPACSDKHRGCPTWKSRGYCRSTSRYYRYMTKNCRKSCGICGGGNVTTNKPTKPTTRRSTRPSTQPPTRPPTTSACVDKHRGCPTWKSRGYCRSTSRYYRYMTKNCRKSCGICGGGNVTTNKPTKPTTRRSTRPSTQPPTRPPTTSACVDKHRGCPTWKSRGYCRSTSRYYRYMTKNCRKSCGICGGRNVTTTKPITPTTRPSTRVSTQPPTRPPTTPGCSDRFAKCPTWRSLGYCKKDSKYNKFMEKYCRKSCGKCGGGKVSTRKPTKRPTRPPTTSGSVTTQRPTQASCGVPEVAQSRVISGINARKGSWPWQILMLYNGRTMCGGSIISPSWVVTAAHCVSGRESSARYFKVRVGEHNTSTTIDGQHIDMSVERIISHPQYSRSTINNDIALMKLSSPIMFGTYVKPVCLPKQDQDVPVGTQCFITGWGKIKHPGSMHHTLQQGRMPVVSNSDCANLNTKNLRIRITDQMVCAGHGGSTRVSGCHGDSGGPFVCQTGANGSWELHGAVSWGSGRCDATQGYTVFARVSKFRTWIDQEMSRY